MKSLDFINDKIDGLEEDIKHFEKHLLEHILLETKRCLENYKQVKRDLEVLEIIKKCRFVGYQKYAGNTLIIDNITDEQYQEIREWLEEQE